MEKENKDLKKEQNKTLPKPIRRISRNPITKTKQFIDLKQPMVGQESNNIFIEYDWLKKRKPLLNKVIDTVFWMPLIKLNKKIKKKEISLIYESLTGLADNSDKMKEIISSGRRNNSEDDIQL